MKKYSSWNNKRHNCYYWISIIFLLVVATNISTRSIIPYVRRNLLIIGNLFDIIWNFYGKLIPSLGITGLEMCTLRTMNLVLILILSIANHMCGVLPDMRLSEESGSYRFIMKTVVLYDICIGLALEVWAIKGFIALSKAFRITSTVIWFYIILLFVGSYLYWENTVPMRKIHQIVKQWKYDQNFENKFWFCISNSDERISTFARAPWNGRVSEVFLDEKDLSEAKKERFIFYLVAIDCSKKLNENLKKYIFQIIRLPHSNVLIMLFGGKDVTTQGSKIKAQTLGYKSVQVQMFEGKHLNRQLDLEKLVSDVNYRQIIEKRNPLKYIRNRELIKTYIEIGSGPKICLDFLKTIMNKLDILPAIYALFDYVDLQYRIMIAYARQPNLKWMKKHWRMVGNFGKMGEIISMRVVPENYKNGEIQLTTQDVFGKIITDTDMKLIWKYLPNYEKKEDIPIDKAVRYLTSSLRNVLRGHGTFEHSDANALFELVFKLALMNTYILSINAITIDVTDDITWHMPSCYYKISAYKSDTEPRELSPFLVASKKGDILVFNNLVKCPENCDKNIMECINYLDGKTTLIKY